MNLYYISISFLYIHNLQWFNINICLWTIAVSLWIWISFYYAITITIILLTTYSIQNLLYQYIVSVQLFNHDFQFQLFVNYNMELFMLFIYITMGTQRLQRISFTSFLNSLISIYRLQIQFIQKRIISVDKEIELDIYIYCYCWLGIQVSH